MEGYPRSKLWYRYGGSFIGTIATLKVGGACPEPKLEFVVNQDTGEQRRPVWPRYPAGCTTSTRRHREWAASTATRPMPAAVATTATHPLEEMVSSRLESRSDYQIFAGIAERLGLKDQFTDGKTEIDWCKALYNASDLSKLVSWEEFDEKGYHIINIADDYKPTPGLRWFYEGRSCDTPDVGNPKRLTEQCKELGTFSGKIEFESVSLKEYFPDDEERPGVHATAPDGRAPQRTVRSNPLQLLRRISFSFHALRQHTTGWMKSTSTASKGRLRPGPSAPSDERRAGSPDHDYVPPLQRPGFCPCWRGHRPGASGVITPTLLRRSTTRCSRRVRFPRQGGCVNLPTVAYAFAERSGYDRIPASSRSRWRLRRCPLWCLRCDTSAPVAINASRPAGRVLRKSISLVGQPPGTPDGCRSRKSSGHSPKPKVDYVPRPVSMPDSLQEPAWTVRHRREDGTAHRPVKPKARPRSYLPYRGFSGRRAAVPRSALCRPHADAGERCRPA